MAGTNQFYTWAGGGSANVLSNSEYASLANLTSGVVAGIASSQQANTTWRQSSIIASMVAQAIADVVGDSVIDNGTISAIEASFLKLFRSGGGLYAQDTGTTNSVVVTFANPPATQSLLTGSLLRILIANTNSSNSTLNVNGFGATAIVNPDGTQLVQGQLAAGTVQTFIFDGTEYRLVGGGAVIEAPYVRARNGLDSDGFDGGGFQVRAVGGNYGVGLRNDGSSASLLQTASGNQYGVYNNFRPYAWNLNTGAVTIDGTGSGTTFGGTVIVSGNEQINGLTFFGSGGQFYADPNHSGNQLLNFATGQYIQYVPGTGLSYNTSGTHTFTGPMSGNLGFTSQSGNIFANGGYLRAGFGARNNTTDANAAAINADFTLFATTSSAGTTGYMIFPAYGTEFIIQWGNITFATPVEGGIGSFPLIFPRACFTIIGNTGFGTAATPAPTTWASFSPRDSSSYYATVGNSNSSASSTGWWIALGN